MCCLVYHERLQDYRIYYRMLRIERNTKMIELFLDAEYELLEELTEIERKENQQ